MTARGTSIRGRGGGVKRGWRQVLGTEHGRCVLVFLRFHDGVGLGAETLGRWLSKVCQGSLVLRHGQVETVGWTWLIGQDGEVWRGGPSVHIPCFCFHAS